MPNKHMKKILKLSLITLSIAITANTSFAFDFSDIKGVFWKESKDKKEISIVPLATTSQVNATTTNQKASTTKDLDTEIKKDDKCEIKKSKLKAKKEALIKAGNSQKEDTEKIIISLETIAENSYEDEIKIINEKVETLKKEVSEVKVKQNEIISLIASTTEMNCTHKSFEKNLIKIKKLEDEKKIEQSEVKDFLNKDIKETLKQIKD